MTPRFALLLAAGFVLMPLGCRDDKGRKLTFPVTGRVTLDAKPAEHAMVVFHPLAGTGLDAVKPRGTVKPDGTFTLTTYDGDDGAPAGEYTVTVELWLAGNRDGDSPSNRLNVKFARPETSGLTATVLPGPTTLDPISLRR